jgi:hypothetical protein
LVGGGSPTAGGPTAETIPPASGATQPAASPQRGYRHWLVIGIGAAVLILVFLLRR